MKRKFTAYLTVRVDFEVEVGKNEDGEEIAESFVNDMDYSFESDCGNILNTEIQDVDIVDQTEEEKIQNLKDEKRGLYPDKFDYTN